MKTLLKLLLLVTLFYSGASLAEVAVTTSNTSSFSSSLIPALQACPASSEQGMNTAQVSQSDCCKGHKGVCGCRAGKIVCCDNTASPNCTCHSDSGIAN